MAKTSNPEKKPTSKKEKRQPKTEGATVLTFAEDTAPRCSYDTAKLTDFLDLVFHTDFDDDENILVWKAAKGRPGYPMAEDEFMKQLKSATKGMPLYFGTSTCRKDEKEDRLFNRKTLFKRLFVVVLDDIGTKVPLNKLPSELEPTYIIESSEGNYQYGYVLEEPIAVLEHAEALIQLVYESGYSDAGGRMATKLVRMPGGTNGKPGAKRNFEVKLTKSNGPLWTPDKLLDVMDLGTTWAEVLADAEGTLKRRAPKSTGTSLWSPIQAYSPGLSGVVDPVLEWLYEMDMVQQEIGDWATIRCPWHLDHESGDDTAGYSALGRGDEYEASRGFKCFHDHCADQTTHDFLSYVATNGGPEAGVRDEAAALVAQWAYDNSSDMVWDIKSPRQPRPISMKAFRNTYPGKAWVQTYDGKNAAVPIATLWLKAPGRVLVTGRTFDPTTTAKIVEHDDELRINMFARPDWGEGLYNADDVQMFVDFLEYLIPLASEREYFLDWLAAKAQNMGFRGAAILMIAKQQGTGRGTLSDMIETMFGTENVEKVPFKRLTSDKNAWNEWQEKPIVVTNETKDTGEGGQSYYKVYESLKDLIDPRPTKERINPKYGQQRISMVYSSYIMFSNHDNALALAGNDRRFYVMRNALLPASPQYFVDLNDWMTTRDKKGEPVWARNVWRWLQERPVSMLKLLAPVPETAAKTDMIQSSKMPLTVAVEAIISEWPGDFITIHVVKDALNLVAGRLNLSDIKNFEGQVKAVLMANTERLPAGITINAAGRTIRPRARLVAMRAPGFTERYMQPELSKADRRHIRESVENVDMKDMQKALTTALDLYEG